MSLNWNLEGIKDYKTICWDEDGSLSGLTECMIFMTIPVKIGRITEANAGEFWARLNFVQKHDGAMMRKVDENGESKPAFFTAEDVVAHIGLSCNVADETRAKFLNAYKRDLDRDTHAVADLLKARKAAA